MQKRIVILGAGFGGAYTARYLERQLKGIEVEIILIDRNNYFTFYPLLVEAGTGSLEPRHAVVSVREFTKSVIFKMAEVKDIDFRNKIIFLSLIGSDETEELEYTQLVISLGSVTNLPDVPGLMEFGFEMKSLPDAVALRDRAILMLELANHTQDAELRESMLHFVVAGSNFTGVEVAGEFNVLMREASKAYSNISEDDCKITLIEIGDRILQALDKDLADYAAENMKKRGINILLNRSISEVRDINVLLDNGKEIPTGTVVWCAGIARNPLIGRLQLPTDERGYILTERDLRVKGFNGVWAIGDCAVNTDNEGNAYPATAQHAVREAKHLAVNISNVIREEKTISCDIENKGAIAALGCRTGVAKFLGIKFSGFWAWFLFRSVYLFKMPGIGRKIRVALDWTMDLLFKREYVQLGVHRKDRKVPEEWPHV